MRYATQKPMQNKHRLGKAVSENPVHQIVNGSVPCLVHYKIQTTGRKD